jgi:hypothetical protein
MTEPWTSQWYMPLVVLGLALVTIVFIALAIVEVLVAAAPETSAPRGWHEPLERADTALGEGRPSDALIAWREARMVALRSGDWEPMVEVADAARRLGVRSALTRETDPLARDAYLIALHRARRQHSLDGMLRAATGFGDLGDREAFEQAVRLAERLAGSDPAARARVQLVTERRTAPPAGRHHVITGGEPR